MRIKWYHTVAQRQKPLQGGTRLVCGPYELFPIVTQNAGRKFSIGESIVIAETHHFVYSVLIPVHYM